MLSGFIWGSGTQFSCACTICYALGSSGILCGTLPGTASAGVNLKLSFCIGFAERGATPLLHASLNLPLGLSELPMSLADSHCTDPLTLCMQLLLAGNMCCALLHPASLCHNSPLVILCSRHVVACASTTASILI